MALNEQIESLVKPVVESHDCHLVLLTFQREKDGWILRLLIEQVDDLHSDDVYSPSSVDHNILATISREVDAVLEEADIIDKTFFLEVSSPGIERPLVAQEDYLRFSGRQAKIKTTSAVNGKKKFTGVIAGIESDVVQLETKAEHVISIPYELIKKANLIYVPGKVRKKTGEA